MVKILVIAAHPDDEVLGCGGTMARLAGDGSDIHIAILAEGVTSRYNQRELADRTLIDKLQRQARKAAQLIGAKEVILKDLPDNRLDTVPLLDVVKIVEDLVADIGPEAIYTHHGGDLNIDHALIHRAVLTATRPVRGQAVREIYAFEVASSTEWAFQRFAPPFLPNVFVDISATLSTKIEAMSCYESETRDFPHPRSPEAINAAARRWGSVVGCAAAEAFELIRAIRL
ncbi:MAG: PIG-L family deacetylase [Acidobacteria bacterium]|nr:PIG-L family deacetylase [Acidobacteriota bacterium]